jgi:hypothetical protein
MSSRGPHTGTRSRRPDGVSGVRVLRVRDELERQGRASPLAGGCPGEAARAEEWVTCAHPVFFRPGRGAAAVLVASTTVGGAHPADGTARGRPAPGVTASTPAEAWRSMVLLYATASPQKIKTTRVEVCDLNDGAVPGQNVFLVDVKTASEPVDRTSLLPKGLAWCRRSTVWSGGAAGTPGAFVNHAGLRWAPVT